MVNEFKQKLNIQMDHVTMKLQSIVNGKENDVNARKSVIHKKLAKHVNKACNGRFVLLAIYFNIILRFLQATTIEKCHSNEKG